VEEFTYAEIADVLHIDIGIVRSRLHRARAKIREAMKKRGLEEYID
jgi:DNA-directed RNA polymerase specialized sigma24 family protein